MFLGDVVMKVQEVLENTKRDYSLEKEILSNFSEALKSYISLSEINDRLEANNFGGVYVLDDNTFYSLEDKSSIYGSYNIGTKSILLPVSHCREKDTGIHEMGHAFLDGRNRSKITIDNVVLEYGLGLEEGAVSLLECNNSISDISKYDSHVYPRESILFKQLDQLYQYADIKEYPNLLIHMFKDPKNFLYLIKEIYEKNFKRMYPKYESYMAFRSAFSMIQGTDILNNSDMVPKDLFNNLKLLNMLYLYVADQDLRFGDKVHPLFGKVDTFTMDSTDKLINLLFGCCDGYMDSMLGQLDKLLDNFQADFETIGQSEMSEKISIHKSLDKQKIILPR